MLRHSDIREAALLMIKRRGKDAAEHATHRALELQVEGKSELAEIWRRIANEIARIRANEPAIYDESLALFKFRAVDTKGF